MATYDLAITGGRVVIPYVGEISADIGVRDGKIVALAEQIGPSEADAHIDAQGKAVLPGGVDAHFHLGIYRDLQTDTESETTSSVVGGVTTILSFFRTGSHYLNKTGPYKEIFPEVLSTVGGHAKVDYGFHLAPMTAEHVSEIPWLVKEMGVSSFKYYMFYKGLNLAADSRDARGYTMAEEYDLGHLMEIMEAARQVDNEVPGRVSEGAIAHAVGLVHRLLDHLGAGCLYAIEGPLEVRGREVQPPQQALRKEVADRRPVRRRDAGIGCRRCEQDAYVGLRGRSHGDPAHAPGAHVAAHLEAQRVAIERDRLVVIVDRQRADVQSHVHRPKPMPRRLWPLLDS